MRDAIETATATIERLEAHRSRMRANTKKHEATTQALLRAREALMWIVAAATVNPSSTE